MTRAQAPTQSTQTLPARAYHDEAVFRAEMRAVFGREWLVLGHESELRRPGDTIASVVGGRPVLVIRDKSGGLRGFHNVCRHRAAPLVPDGAHHCAALRCPYHGWLYDTDGVLRKRPGFANADQLDGRSLALHPIRAEAWRGFVLVNLDLAAGPVEAGLGGLPAALASFPIERYAHHARRTFDLDFNWKTYTDNYLEGYHIPYMHKGLAADLDMPTYRVENGDRISVHRSAPKGEAGAYQGLFLWRWPNNTIGVYGAGFNICRILPVSPRAVRLVFDFFFDPAAGLPAAEKDRAAATTCAVVEEDFPMCRAVQRNLEAGVYDTGPLSPRHEAGLALFHGLVRAALDGEPGASVAGAAR